MILPAGWDVAFVRYGDNQVEMALGGILILQVADIDWDTDGKDVELQTGIDHRCGSRGA